MNYWFLNPSFEFTKQENCIDQTWAGSRNTDWGLQEKFENIFSGKVFSPDAVCSDKWRVMAREGLDFDKPQSIAKSDLNP